MQNCMLRLVASLQNVSKGIMITNALPQSRTTVKLQGPSMHRRLSPACRMQIGGTHALYKACARLSFPSLWKRHHQIAGHQAWKCLGPLFWKSCRRGRRPCMLGVKMAMRATFVNGTPYETFDVRPGQTPPPRAWLARSDRQFLQTRFNHSSWYIKQHVLKAILQCPNFDTTRGGGANPAFICVFSPWKNKNTSSGLSPTRENKNTYS